VVEVGEKAPQFSLPDQGGRQVSLKDYKGRWVVLYFYPRDNTSGCTLEAIDFTTALKDFEKLGASVLGMSPDSVESHVKFRDRHQLSITLLSDPGHKILDKYGAWGTRKLYGREVKGVIRSTVLINREGKIAHAWSRVKVKGHVDAVKGKLAELSQ